MRLLINSRLGDRCIAPQGRYIATTGVRSSGLLRLRPLSGAGVRTVGRVGRAGQHLAANGSPRPRRILLHRRGRAAPALVEALHSPALLGTCYARRRGAMEPAEEAARGLARALQRVARALAHLCRRHCIRPLARLTRNNSDAARRGGHSCRHTRRCRSVPVHGCEPRQSQEPHMLGLFTVHTHTVVARRRATPEPAFVFIREYNVKPSSCSSSYCCCSLARSSA